jgi:hypothetical protein
METSFNAVSGVAHATSWQLEMTFGWSEKAKILVVKSAGKLEKVMEFD